MTILRFIPIICLTFAACVGHSPALHKAHRSLNFTPIDKIDSLQKEAKRTMVIYIHTTWCRVCEHMEQTTWSEPALVEKLNQQFYFLRIDAEDAEDITFQGHSYNSIKHGPHRGTHQLVRALSGYPEVSVYPTTVIMEPNGTITWQSSGYMTAEALHYLLDNL